MEFSEMIRLVKIGDLASLANTFWEPQTDSSRVCLVRSVLWSDDWRVLFVLNQAEPDKQKPQGWGIPGGKAKPGKTLYTSANDEVEEENNLFTADFQLDPAPFDAYVQSGRIQVWFCGFLQEFTEIPPNPNDPNKDIVRAALIDPSTQIETVHGKSMFQGEEVYPRHLRQVLLSKTRLPVRC